MHKIAIVISKFNQEITTRLYQGAIDRCEELDISTHNIKTVWVPGAVEIPLAAQFLAATKQYQAIICLGAVIRGETTHFEEVCNQVSHGSQAVALKYSIPMIFGVLTTDSEEQAFERAGGKHGHKGRDCVDAALEMIQVLSKIESE